VNGTDFSPRAVAGRAPDRAAIIMTGSDVVVTFRELEERSSRAANLLRAHGLGPGDHIAMLLPNDEHALEVAWAAHRVGLYYTMVNSRLTPDEAAYVVDDCGARVVVASAAIAPLARALIPRTPGVERRFVLGGDLDGYESYETANSEFGVEPAGDEHEGSPMLYSSGTTGRPKGVKRALSGAPFGTTHQLVGGIERRFGIGDGKVYLTPAPLYHAAPLSWSMAAQAIGATVVLMEHFDAAACLGAIERCFVTHGQFVPTMFVRMLKLPDAERAAFEVSSLESVVHAAAPCPVEIKRQMIEWWGPIVHEYYAGTEGGGLTWITSDEWLAHPGSVGPAMWGEIHVCDDDGNELGPGEEGVVWLGGTGVGFEYHNDPDKTRQAYDPQGRGWNTLSDVGYVDDDGYLYLTDRKTYMIVTGGVNVYPQEVENLLVLHPDVVDVAVFGVPDEDLGEQVKAVVQVAAHARPGPELEARLIEYCRARLAHYKCPRSVDFDPELPRGENGKLYKRILRDRYWQGHVSRVL
jgi:acyl-CoA synthetase (AMP-forming)/AMP-acid ligase II